MSPTARTLHALRADDWLAEVCSWHTKFPAQAGSDEKFTRRHDLFGFADIVAIRGETTLYVQATSTSNVGSRVAKIVTNPKAKVILYSTLREIQVWGWRKYKQKVDRKIWRPTVKRITLADCISATAPQK